MKKYLSLALGISVCLSLAACATHRRDLVTAAPPQTRAAQSDAMLAAAAALIEHESARRDRLSVASLTPLTSAAALLFHYTGSPRMLALTREFAGDLLTARVSEGAVTGFFGPQGGLRICPQTTSAAGLALADAAGATGQADYVDAATAAATAVTSPRLGWKTIGGHVGVAWVIPEKLDIAATADAALLLAKASHLGARGLMAKERAALRTLYSEQAAVGRWWAFVGTQVPMNFEQWAGTLYDLQAIGSKEAAGITGAAIPALARNVFGDGSRIDQTAAREPAGVAMAARTIAAYGSLSTANRIFQLLLKNRRSDGTAGFASPSDDVAQSYFALALAQQLAGPV